MKVLQIQPIQPIQPVQSVLATIHQVLYQPIIFKLVALRTPKPLTGLAQALNRPVTPDLALGTIGVVLFLFSLLCVAWGSRWITPAIPTLLSSTGWFVTGGWLLQRWSAGERPFGVGFARIRWRLALAVKQAKKRHDLTCAIFGLSCLTMMVFALWAITG